MFNINNISPTELNSRMQRGEDMQLIDIREPHERSYCSIGGLHIPIAELKNRFTEIDTQKPVVVYCHRGERSFFAITMLQTMHGLNNLLNLKSGINGWSVDVDTSVPIY